VLRDASFPANEFEQLKREAIAALEAQRQEPGPVASRALARHLSPYPKGHPRYALTLDENLADLKAVTNADVQKFHADVYGLAQGELTVVGDFDRTVVGSLAADLFRGWKSKVPYARIPAVYKDMAPINEALATPDKANAYLSAGVNLDLRQDDPDYAALVLGNYMLGGGFLNSRLATRIRQKDGLSYGIGSSLSADPLDRSGRFGISAIYAPQNVQRLEAAMREELARALADGFTTDEVGAAKTGWLQSRQVSRAQDGELANRLGALSFQGRTLAFDAELERRVEALTPAAILTAMRRHIDVKKLTIVKAGDFSK